MLGYFFLAPGSRILVDCSGKADTPPKNVSVSVIEIISIKRFISTTQVLFYLDETFRIHKVCEDFLGD